MSPRKNKNENGGGKQNPVAIQSYLKGINYPATKQDVIDAANDNDAPIEVIDVLEKVPEMDYESPAALTKVIGKLE